MEITDLMLLNMFKQCTHIHIHRQTQFRGQGRILILLKEKGTITQRELINHTQRRSATLSEQLEKMEKAEWIIREKCESDKRNVSIRLTDLGVKMADEAIREREESAHKLFHLLEKEDREQFYRILNLLKENWEQLEVHSHEEHRLKEHDRMTDLEKEKI